MNTATTINSEMQEAMDGSTALVESIIAIDNALASVEKERPAAITSRLDLEAELAHVESSAALGEEGAHADVAESRRSLTLAKEKLDGLSARKRGLEQRKKALLPDLLASHRALQDHMSSYRVRVREEFLPGWTAAITEFSRCLKTLATIESAIQWSFDLPQPDPSLCNDPVDVGDIGRPVVLLNRLILGIAQIQAEKERAVRASNRRAVYDHDGLYRFLKPWAGHRNGETVTADVLGAEGPFLLESHVIRAVDHRLDHHLQERVDEESGVQIPEADNDGDDSDEI